MTETDRSYVSQTDVERVMGVVAAETNITQAHILAAIKNASAEVDKITGTTYHSVEDSGTATGGSTTTLIDTTKSATWTANEYQNYVVWIYSGTAADQYAVITSNTTTTLTFGAITTAPVAGDLYRILPDCISEQYVDGNAEDWRYFEPYPIKSLLTLTIAGTSVTTTKVSVYEETGKIKLQKRNYSPEKTYFSNEFPKDNYIKYVYGVYPIPAVIKQLTACIAGIQCLTTQIGGTYNDLTSYSVPGVTASLGEPYMNVREALYKLKDQADALIKRVTIYHPVEIGV